MMRLSKALFACASGAAAAEMALVAPILIVLAMGSVEMGNYFMSNHIVHKGVRDGSRFAARQRLADLTDPVCTLDTTSGAQDRVKRVTRTGDPDGVATPRLVTWTSDTTVTLSLACTTGTYTGVYTEFPDGAPVVTVAAVVPYTPLFPFLPFNDALSMRSESQAAVFGG